MNKPFMREDWIEIELRKVLLQSKEKHKPERIEKLFYVGLEHIEKNSGELTEDVGEEEINTVKNKFDNGQILYGKLRPYLNKAHLAKRAGVCSTDILVFEVSDVVLPKYAIHYVLSRKFVNDMSANTSGVNLPRVSTKYIKNYSFPLAPLPEQRAIVAKTEQLFSKLDNGIANLKAAKEKLEIYRQTVLKKAFEGELTKEWREKNYLNIQEWKNVKISDVSEVLNGDRGKNYPSRAHYVNSGIPFVSAGNIGEGWKLNEELNFITEERFDLLRAGILQKGDIVYCIRGSIGKFAIIDFKVGAIASSLCIIRINDLINRNYLCYFLDSHLCRIEIKKYDNGTAQPNLSAKDFKRFQLPLPSKKEQDQIVQKIETRLSVCDKVLADIKEALEKSEALLQSILKKAFEGKLLSEAELEACRKEPDWEPAEKLLTRNQQSRNERMKNEKATIAKFTTKHRN